MHVDAGSGTLIRADACACIALQGLARARCLNARVRRFGQRPCRGRQPLLHLRIVTIYGIRARQDEDDTLRRHGA